MNYSKGKVCKVLRGAMFAFFVSAPTAASINTPDDLHIDNTGEDLIVQYAQSYKNALLSVARSRGELNVFISILDNSYNSSSISEKTIHELLNSLEASWTALNDAKYQISISKKVLDKASNLPELKRAVLVMHMRSLMAIQISSLVIISELSEEIVQLRNMTLRISKNNYAGIWQTLFQISQMLERKIANIEMRSKTRDNPLLRWIYMYDVRQYFDGIDDLMRIYKCNNLWVTELGDDNDNILSGTKFDDVIHGLGGNDIIQKDIYESGDDTICGGSGDDKIYARDGNNTVLAGPGDDIVRMSDLNFTNKVWGGYGDDNIQGPSGPSGFIHGGPGNDIVFAGFSVNQQGNVIYGDDGDDSITGGFGNDHIFGGQGSDALDGHGGDDTLYAGPSNGDLFTSHGPMIVHIYPDGSTCGGTDWDYVFGGDGNDVIYGEGGKDYLSGNNGQDQIYGGYDPNNANDASQFPDLKDCIYGGNGSDTAYGNEGDDNVYGENGDDTLYGNTGNDYLWGYDGNDTLRGGGGSDTLRGDNSECGGQGTSGEDNLYGGGGDDSLWGGPLADYCDGQDGTDSTDNSCETTLNIP